MSRLLFLEERDSAFERFDQDAAAAVFETFMSTIATQMGHQG